MNPGAMVIKIRQLLSAIDQFDIKSPFDQNTDDAHGPENMSDTQKVLNIIKDFGMSSHGAASWRMRFTPTSSNRVTSCSICER